MENLSLKTKIGTNKTITLKVPASNIRNLMEIFQMLKRNELNNGVNLKMNILDGEAK